MHTCLSIPQTLDFSTTVPLRQQPRDAGDLVSIGIPKPIKHLSGTSNNAIRRCVALMLKDAKLVARLVALTKTIGDFAGHGLAMLFDQRRRRKNKTTAKGPADKSPKAPIPRRRVTGLRHRPAHTIAQCFDNWGDLDEALSYLTPEANGVWDNVAFTRAAEFPPDWHLIFNSPGKRKLTLRGSPNRVLFAIGEPPTQTHLPMHMGQARDTVVLTPNETLVNQPNPSRRYVLTPALVRTRSVKKTYKELDGACFPDKPARLSWVTSNLALLPGHRYRLRFLERLQAHISFDLFGRGFRPIADKWEGLAPYRYSLAFENTVSDYYFTEKLMDCFVAGAMPIYFGSAKITEFFPEESMVIIDPEDPDVFDRIADIVASDLWHQRRDVIHEAKQLVLKKYNTFAQIARFIQDDANSEPMQRRVMKFTRIDLDFSASN